MMGDLNVKLVINISLKDIPYELAGIEVDCISNVG